jgi:hypothetical protein
MWSVEMQRLKLLSELKLLESSRFDWCAAIQFLVAIVVGTSQPW